MDTCNSCGIEYPDGYTAPIMTTGGGSGGVCGICALEISNEALGVERTEFQGEIAEELRQLAIKFRKENNL